MIVIGIILLLLGLALGGFIVAGGLPGEAGTDVSFSLFGLSVDTSAVVVFAMGALTLLLLELGVFALRSGARSTSRRRAELQRLRRVEAEVQARQSAEAQRNATTTAPAASSPAPFARREPDPATRPESGRSTGQTGSHGRPAGDDDAPAARSDDRTTRIGSDDRPPTETGTGTGGGTGTPSPDSPQGDPDSTTRTDRP